MNYIYSEKVERGLIELIKLIELIRIELLVTNSIKRLFQFIHYYQ